MNDRFGKFKKGTVKRMNTINVVGTQNSILGPTCPSGTSPYRWAELSNATPGWLPLRHPCVSLTCPSWVRTLFVPRFPSLFPYIPVFCRSCQLPSKAIKFHQKYKGWEFIINTLSQRELYDILWGERKWSQMGKLRCKEKRKPQHQRE